MTKWLMDDVSLSPMRNVSIYRTHWAIQQNINREKSGKNKPKTKNQKQFTVQNTLNVQ